MERRGRLRKAPGSTPENTTHRSSNRTCKLGSMDRGKEGCCVGRSAHPVPAALLLALAIAAGNGVVVVAFAPVLMPSDWAVASGGGARRDSGEAYTDSTRCLRAQVAGAGGGAGGVVRAYRRRGRSDRNFWCHDQTMLCATGPGQTEPDSIETATTPADRPPNRAKDLPENSASQGVPKETGGRLGRVVERGGRGRGWGRGRGQRAATTKGVATRKGTGKKLAQLVMIEVGVEEPPVFSDVNNTELSQKVEAQLFEQYDAMVPGPAASLAAVGATDGDPDGAQERTGRPLAINLDLLSYHARQKALAGDHVEARALYRRCVELDPRDGRGWLGLARQMQKMHKPDKAQMLFEAGLDNCPDNPFLLQAYAVMEEERGNQAKALTLLNRSVRINPNHTASWVALGLLNERNRRIDEARGCFEKAVKNDPKSHYAWLVWAMLEKRFGSVEVARSKFKTCLRINPRNAKTYQAWGVLEAEEGNYELAAELFKEGLEQRADNTYIMQAWALMEAKRGDISAAKTLFKQALIARPRDGAVWQAYALLMKDLGDVDGARALFKQGIVQAPKHCPTWQAWGMMEWQLGNVHRARKLFQEGVWESPKGPFVVRILQAWAILEATEGNYHEARKYFGFALARDPYSVPVMVAWALMEESLGDIGRARQLFEIAANTESSNPNIWSVYEQAEARGGFLAEAKSVYERGVMALMNASQAGSSGPNAWWDKSVMPREVPGPPRGESLIDQASRSLTTSSAEMALRVSRIIGGVQWARDYMSFGAMNGSRSTRHGGEMAFDQ